MQLPAKSTGSFPWGHVMVVVFILTQGDAQQQRTLCVALTGSSYLTSGRRRWETLGFLSASCCWPGQANRLLLELKLPLFVDVTGVPPVSWVWLPFLRQPRVSHFSGANKLWDSGTPALWSRPLAQQYTQHVVRDTSGGCKCPLWACLALELRSHYGFCFRLCALLLLRKILFCWWAR